jgi:hypothetical protein
MPNLNVALQYVSTTPLAWGLMVLGAAAMLGGLIGIVRLRRSAFVEPPHRYAIMFLLIIAGPGLVGIGQALRLLLAIHASP